MNNLPLRDIRVLDFSHAAAGPYATQCLADMGADVIKVEKPGRGDGARYMGAPMLGPSLSDYFAGLNRNKRSVLIDLGTPQGVSLALRLAEQCDVVVQNFRPGVLDRLGLGYDVLRTRRRGLVFCSVSAFGPDGPWRDKPANDVVMQSVSGLMGITGEADGGPVKIGTPICDYVSGLFGLIGVLAALRVRDDHPEGQHVEIAMLDASVAMMSNYIPSVIDLGKSVPRLGRAHAQLVPYQAFVCADGEYVMVGAFTDAFWRRLCHAIGRPELIDDERFATNGSRLAHRDSLIPLLEKIFQSETRAHWVSLLDAADVPNSPVFELPDALRSEQARHRGVITAATDGRNTVHTASFPVRAQAWGRPPAGLAPRMGQHTGEILTSLLGMSDSELERLAHEQVIGLETEE